MINFVIIFVTIFCFNKYFETWIHYCNFGLKYHIIVTKMIDLTDVISIMMMT